MDVDTRLRQVFADVFDVEPGSLVDDASPQSIEAWDSVGHLNLVLALEGEFGVQFEAEEIPELVLFGRIRQRLSSGVYGEP